MTSRIFIAMAFVIALMFVQISAQTTEFTYQGKLNTSGSPANGNFDFEFLLFDASTGGSQVGSIVAVNNVAVADGIFAVKLNFGNQFTGDDRYLEIRVRPNGQPGMTILGPRQLINSAPYSVRSLNAATATDATQLGGIAASEYVVTTDPRMTDARTPVAGSLDYIQNTTLQQSKTNFNISGNGTADVFNATTEFRISDSRILRSPDGNLFVGFETGVFNSGSDNSFFGGGAGRDNTSGNANSFFGKRAGLINTTAAGNSFFGSDAGGNTTTGGANSFFGREAGFNNSSGTSNSFFGRSAGVNNTTGIDNSFFGRDSGFSNLSERNSFFGRSAGLATNVGSDNAFFGYLAGGGNTTGQENTFFGAAAGITNVTGNSNTAIGRGADVGSSALVFATAVGAGTIVTQNNRVQIGRDGVDTVRIGSLTTAAGTQLCRFGFVLSECSSSRRYKENIVSFYGGLDLVRRFQPVTFDWKGRVEHDLGLIAEEVGEVEPLLVTRNSTGEFEGVKYDQLTIVLINAVKEQQNEIERQRKLIDKLEKRLSELEKREKTENR